MDHSGRSQRFIEHVRKNRWDNGTVGNYYASFSCTDEDDDGICDLARHIPGGASVDALPLTCAAALG